MVLRFFTRSAGATTDVARTGEAAAAAARGVDPGQAARVAGDASGATRGVEGGAARGVEGGSARGVEGGAARGVEGGAARGADEAGDAGKAGDAGMAGDAGKAGDGGKAEKSSFLSENAGTLLTGGLVAGGLYYLDQNYKEEKKKVKDCMKVCLPDNWDDHAYGDLEKSELKYKEIADAGEQPLCTAEIEDCGQYCGDKCKEIHDFDAPGSGLAEGLAGDLGEGLGGVFKSIFGGLFEGMGLDTSVVGYASSASSSMICMVLMIMLLK